MPLGPAPIHVRSDFASSAGRAVQDIALGALIGGNLFGRLAMHPALADISEESERGRVLNHAWRRYGTVNSLAMVALVGGWLPARVNETRPLWLSRRERTLALTKDIALGATVVTGLASAASGVSFARQAPQGAVPLESGNHPGPGTPARAASLKRLASAIGAANLGAELALATANAFLSQANFRRPPVRRVLRRRY